MKKSKFIEEQIAYALKQAELGTPVAEVCRKMRTASPLAGSTFCAIAQPVVRSREDSFDQESES